MKRRPKESENVKEFNRDEKKKKERRGYLENVMKVRQKKVVDLQ